MKIEYPKFLYHATEAACIVNGPEEHAALGDGWQETPVDVEKPEKQKGNKKA